jgi:hypothetical protein
MDETKNRRYGSSSGEMAFSPGLGDRGIETATCVTGESSAGISVIAVSDVALARELFRNWLSESSP